MIPTIDIYVLHFNTQTARGMKSYHDFMSHVQNADEADKAYWNVTEDDHVGHKTVTIRQFSNRRAELIQRFEWAKINHLIEEFQVYGR